MSNEATVSVSVFSQPSLSNHHLLHPSSSSQNNDHSPSKRSQEVPHAEVLNRFRSGCPCVSQEKKNCFSELDPVIVHAHRLNVADLSREELDMYLMGLLTASLRHPGLTSRKKERTRLKTDYFFFGKELCLDAFLYVQNTNRYQIKSLRKHLMTQGLSPRVHGNAGKRPQNAFSLSEYEKVRGFLKDYLESVRIPSCNSGVLLLPSYFNAKRIHSVYTDNFSSSAADEKNSHSLMSYTTFRRFLSEQFPSLKYDKAQKIVEESIK
eukprot:TRINITY_DN15323_c0_g1_i1.p1 TRINITY_DN15323_c0_g1~~TRINITY_DN15323_c0_g1_i1.p1  ORF type:complete len:265 (-),score=57.92 TRINITY_DN15323_c0_g1_i1:388-1182(-)